MFLSCEVKILAHEKSMRVNNSADKKYTCKHALFCYSILTSWSMLMSRTD